MTDTSAGAANRPRLLFSAAVALLVGAAVHVDWHLARAHHHGRLSFETPWHWLIAIPVFALVPWYTARRWPNSPDRIGALAIILGLILGDVVEPMWEFMTGAPAEWAFGIERRTAFAEFFATGLVTYLVTRYVMRRLGAMQR